MDSGDGRIERELHPLVEESVSEGKGQGNWEVKVWTSDIRGAGTDANVTLQVKSLSLSLSLSSPSLSLSLSLLSSLLPSHIHEQYQCSLQALLAYFFDVASQTFDMDPNSAHTLNLTLRLGRTLSTCKSQS